MRLPPCPGQHCTGPLAPIGVEGHANHAALRQRAAHTATTLTARKSCAHTLLPRCPRHARSPLVHLGAPTEMSVRRLSDTTQKSPNPPSLADVGAFPLDAQCHTPSHRGHQFLAARVTLADLENAALECAELIRRVLRLPQRLFRPPPNIFPGGSGPENGRASPAKPALQIRASRPSPRPCGRCPRRPWGL